VILFGGGDTNDGQVWTYWKNGLAHWESMTPEGAQPVARVEHAAIFDGPRDRMILFGGIQQGAFLGDLWALNRVGESWVWEALTPAGVGPGPRGAHTMIYDEGRDRVIVFGGYGPLGAKYGDIWELSLDGVPTWTQITPATGLLPAARYQHTAVYDPFGERMVVYGGSGVSNYTDTWLLDLDGPPQWTRLSVPVSQRPMQSTGHVAVVDPVERRMILTAGGPGGGTFALSLDETPTWSESWYEGGDVFDHSPGVYFPVSDRILYFGYGFSSGEDFHTSVTGLSWARAVDVPRPMTIAPALGIEPVSPNPVRVGSGVRAAFTLPAEGAALLEVIDVAGRRRFTREVGALGAGRHQVDLGGLRLDPGLYWLRLSRAGASVATKVVLTR